MTPPKLIRIGDVPKWISQEYGIEPPPTRQTVYNWTKRGKNGLVLKTVTKFGNLHVSERWLHEFASHL